MRWSPVWAETSPAGRRPAWAVWMLEAGTLSVHLCAVGAGPSSGLSRLCKKYNMQPVIVKSLQPRKQLCEPVLCKEVVRVQWLKCDDLRLEHAAFLEN